MEFKTISRKKYWPPYGLEVELYGAYLHQDGILISPQVAYELSDKSGLIKPQDLGPVKLLVMENWLHSYLLSILDVITEDLLDCIDLDIPRTDIEHLKKIMSKKRVVIASTDIVGHANTGWLYKVPAKLLKFIKNHMLNN